MRGYRRVLVPCLTVATLVMTACGGDEATPRAGGKSPGGTAAKTINVTLKEWSVLLQTGHYTAPAGSVTFNVLNEGPAHKHEFVLFKTDLAPSALPTKADGSVNEDASSVQLIGEIEEFAAGSTQSKTFTLTAGKYVIFCNVVEEQPTADMGGIKAHYKLGMFYQDPFLIT